MSILPSLLSVRTFYVPIPVFFFAVSSATFSFGVSAASLPILSRHDADPALGTSPSLPIGFGDTVSCCSAVCRPMVEMAGKFYQGL